MPGSPPPGAPFGGPPGGGGGVDAKAALATPALLMTISGGLGIGFGLLGILYQLVTALLSNNVMAGLIGAAVGIVFSLAFIIGNALVLYAGMQARALKGHTLVMVGSVVACLPFCVGFPCCLLGLPAGILTIMAIIKPEIKAQFT